MTTQQVNAELMQIIADMRLERDNCKENQSSMDSTTIEFAEHDGIQCGIEDSIERIKGLIERIENDQTN